MTIRMVGVSKVLNALTLLFFYVFVGSEEIGTVDPQGP
jgi:hypothetical protein